MADLSKLAQIPSDLDGVVQYLQLAMPQLLEALTEQDDLYRTLHVAPTKPREGLIRYADGSDWDPGKGEGLYRYNSLAAWARMGPGLLIPLDSVEVTSAVANVELTIPDEDWQAVFVIIANARFDSDAANVFMQVYTSSTLRTASYKWAKTMTNSSPASTPTGNASDASISLFDAIAAGGNSSAFFDIVMSRPRGGGSSGHRNIKFSGSGVATGNIFNSVEGGGAYHGDTAEYEKIRIDASVGSLVGGMYVLYGLNR